MANVRGGRGWGGGSGKVKMIAFTNFAASSKSKRQLISKTDTSLPRFSPGGKHKTLTIRFKNRFFLTTIRLKDYPILTGRRGA